MHSIAGILFTASIKGPFCLHDAVMNARVDTCSGLTAAVGNAIGQEMGTVTVDVDSGHYELHT